MTRAALATSLALVAASLAAACSKKRIGECDAFVRTSEKLAACPKVPEAQRATIRDAAKQVKDVLEAADDMGGFEDAPKDVVDEMRSTCKSQTDRMVAEMTTAFPECLK